MNSLSPAAPTRRRSGSGLRLTLPVGWFPIDPANPSRRTAQVHELVEAKMGLDPDRSAIRQVLLDTLTIQAAAAGDENAWLLAIGALEMFDPPIPVSLIGAWRPGTTVGCGLEHLISTVEDRHPGAALDLGTGAFGPVLRALRTATAEDLPLTVAEYWTDPGLDDDHLVTVSFTVPQRTFAAPLLEFFDAVVSTLRTADDTTGWQVGEAFPLPLKGMS